MPGPFLSPEWVASVLAETRIAAWSYDIQNETVCADGKLGDLFGYSRALAQGGHLSDYIRAIHPQDQSRVREQLEMVRAHGGLFESEYRVFSRSGELRHVLSRAMAEPDESGIPVRLSGVAIDVSNWKNVDLERLQFVQLVESSQDLIGLCDLSGRFVFANQACLKLLRAERPEDLWMKPLRSCFNGEDFERLDESLAAVCAGQSLEFALRFGPEPYENRMWMSHRFFPLTDQDGQVSSVALVSRDIGEQKRAEQVLELENIVLQEIAADRTFQQVLEALALAVERMSVQKLLVSVLTLDSETKQLLQGAAPSLPEVYNQAIHGLPIGPEVGSCGTAAFTGQCVAVEDISSHPYWKPFKELALSHGLAACTSLPIRSLEGRVLGTLATYYSKPMLPADHDLTLMQSASELAAVVIERERVRRILHRNEAEFQTLANSIPQLTWMARPDGHLFWFNQPWFAYTGSTLAEAEGQGWQQYAEPEAIPLLREQFQVSIAACQPFEMEFSLRDQHGVYRMFLTRAQPLLDEHGKVQRWFGTSTDVDEQRRSVERTLKLVEATSQAIWSADAEGFFQEYSPSWARLTGQNAEQMVNQGWLQAIEAADRERVAGEWGRAIREKRPFSCDFRVWSKQNCFRNIRSQGVPVAGSQGSVMEWIVANSDVTEQVEAERQLQERARYASFRSRLKEALNHPESREDILEGACEALTSRLGFTSAAIWLAEPDSINWCLKACSGLRPAFPFEQISDSEAEIARLARLERGLLKNSLAPDGPGELSSWGAQQGFQALVCQQLRCGPEAFGLMVGFSPKVLPVNITSELRDAADVVTNALDQYEARLQQSLLLEREQAARLEAETLLSLASVLAQEPSLKGFVQQVTDAGVRLTGAAFGAFFYNVADERGESYTLYTISGVPLEQFSKFPMPRKTAVFAPTFDGLGTVLSDDIQADPRYGRADPHFGLPKGHLPVKSYLAVPVRRKNGEVVGGLFFGHSESGRFEQRHARAAECVAAHAAFGFDRTPLV